MLRAAFWHGYDARLAGKGLDACTYPVGSEARSEWLRGYGDDDDLKTVDELKADASTPDRSTPAPPTD